MSSNSGSPGLLRKRSAPDDEFFELERHRNKQFRRELDEADTQQASRQSLALKAAADHHQSVRDNAKWVYEQVMLRHQIAVQDAATQREIAQQQAIAQARADLLERERQALLLREQNQRAEEQRLELVAAREAARLAEEKAAEEARMKPPAPPPQLAPKPQQVEQPQAVPRTAVVPQPDPPQTAEAAATRADAHGGEHQQYLELHRRLKQLRRDLLAKAKSDKALKSTLGDNRREITKVVGQMTSGPSAKQANNGRVAAIVKILQQAKHHAHPSLDVRTYVLSSRRLEGLDGAQCQIPAVFIYLLNIFVKAVIKQFIGEAGISPDKADPVGLLVAKIFSHAEFQWPGQNGEQFLTDILLAKFHKACPLLFGVYGSIKTAAGRERSGWRDDDDVQRYSERMTGLGAGFASITTRDFRRAKVRNPMPVSLFWRALAVTVNTPPAQAIDAHFLVLKAMLDPTYVEKLLNFYGRQAIALVRKGAIDFPSHAQSSAANALKVLPDVYAKTEGLGPVVSALASAT